MAEIRGFPNKAIAEMVSELLQQQDILKFLAYTDIEGEDILSKPTIDDPSELLDKNIFVGRRLPYILGSIGAYITLRMGDLRPTTSKNKKVKTTTIDVFIIVHNSCQKTLNGSRDIALVSDVQSLFENKQLGGVGDCRIVRTADMMGLPVEYSGYNVICEIQSYN